MPSYHAGGKPEWNLCARVLHKVIFFFQTRLGTCAQGRSSPDKVTQRKGGPAGEKQSSIFAPSSESHLDIGDYDLKSRVLQHQFISNARMLEEDLASALSPLPHEVPAC